MRLLALTALIVCVFVTTGCKSTFEKAAEAQKAAGTVAEVNAVDIKQNADVTADTLAIITSADGLTAAVVVKVTAKAPGSALIWAPIEVKLLDAAGKEVGTNNIPGALPILIHLASAEGGKDAYYVNDQILLAGTPATAKVVIDGKMVPMAAPGNLDTTEPKIVKDPSFGDSWTTTVTNNTGIRQEQLVVQAIVRDGDKIVGVGTANIDGLDPGASVEIIGYFIGSSAGTIEVTAPASNAKDGSGAPAIAAAGDSTDPTT